MEQSEAPTRELTLDEAVSIAILLQKNGQLVEAEEVYRRIFDIAPNHPEALHYAGVLAHQQGRSDEAIALIEKSLGLVPDRADCYSNLGIVFQAQGKLDDAIVAYQRAISTAILVCCCERPANRSTRKPPIEQPFAWIPITSMRTPTWAFF